MPPSDPRENPSLKRALPADTVANGTRAADGNPAEVLFGDGSWRLVTIVARWDDRHGRPVVQLSWHAAGTGWSESYLYEAEKVREG